MKELGVSHLCEMMSKILQSRTCAGFHFYTLNLEKSVTKVLHRLNLVPPPPAVIASEQPDQVKSPQKPLETYITGSKSEWDDFPNERWGDDRSPAFGNLINEVWYSSLENADISKELIERSHQIQSEEHVFQIFADFCAGKVASLPWVPEPLASGNLPFPPFPFPPPPPVPVIPTIGQ